jgi:microcystin-dependent protein
MAITFDAKKNLAYTVVGTAPSPAISGTSLVVSAGTGVNFPAVPFNATVWPTGVQPTLANAELVRVTAISTDTLTITRATEGSVARTILAGDQIAATITAKALTDVEAAITTAANVVCPVGVIQMWATGTAPTGWLLCDGTAVSRATYSELFALWSTTFGVGDGSTTFNVPDMRQRIPIGKHASVAALDTIGETQGSWDHTHAPGSLTVASHTHGPGSLAVASHSHTSGTLTVASHSHGAGTLTVASHTHDDGTLGADNTNIDHTHSLPSHTHTFSDSGTTDSPAGAYNSQEGAGVTIEVIGSHVHDFSVSGTTDGGGSGTSGAMSTSATHDHGISGSTGATAPAVSSGTTGTTAPAVSSGSTGSTTPLVDAGITGPTAPAVSTGVTAAGNPPVLVLNFIVRAVSTV